MFDYFVVLPVLVVGAYALLALLLTPFLRSNPRSLAAVSAIGLLVAGFACVRQWGIRQSTAWDMVRADEFSVFFSLVFILVGLLTVMFSPRYLERHSAHHGEYYTLLLLAVAGMMTMAGSENLLVIFIGLELLSMPLYVLSGLTRTRPRSVEASLKYFLLGAFSTGFILYGLAFIYGAAGTLRLPDLMAGTVSTPAMLMGSALVFVGFAFKIAAVPFHFWAPDVYEGAPTTVTGFMAAGTKAAAFAALLRVLIVGFESPEMIGAWRGAVIVIAILTMTVGNLVALAQTSVKRMLAYSSIAHAGYLLIAVATVGEGMLGSGTDAAALGDSGVQALGFYLVSYSLMTMGAFAVAGLIAPEGEGGERGYSLATYNGLGRKKPALAAVMTLFMLSLAGLPPTAGFVAKLYLFKGAIDAGLMSLAIAGILNAVVAAAYYLKVVVAMYMKESGEAEPDLSPAGVPSLVGLGIAVAGTLALGLFPARLLDAAYGLFSAIR